MLRFELRLWVMLKRFDVLFICLFEMCVMVKVVIGMKSRFNVVF